MPNDIFISYARQDLEFVKQLHQDLTTRGFLAWFDTEENPGPMHNLVNLDPIIRESKVLLLVLSPDAVASKDVDDHLRRAKNLYAKSIVPLIWRTIPGDLPKPMQNYLIGIERIDFTGTTSVENFNKLANTLSKYISGPPSTTFTIPGDVAEVTRVTGNKVIMDSATKTPGTPSQVEAPVSAGRRLGAMANKPTVTQKTISPLALGAQVVSNIIIPLELDPVDEEMIEGEIRWLFSAVDQLLRFLGSEVERSQPVTESIPPKAHILPEANNQLLNTLSDDDLKLLTIRFEAKSSNLLTHLDLYLNRNLRQLLQKETQMGEAGKGDGHLQSQIKDTRIRAINTVQEIAQAIDQAYGIQVNSPNQLLEILERHVNPILLGSWVISKVITPLGLSAEDEAFVTAEVKWLFSAADNYQRIYQAVVKKLVEEKKKLTGSGLRKKSLIEALTRRLLEIRQEEIAASDEPLSVTIPSDAQISPEATNRLLNLLDKNELFSYFDIREENIYNPLNSQIASALDQIRSQLQGLDTLTQREVKMGEEGKRNIELQNNLKNNRLYIIKVLQQMAQQMSEAYGVLVSTPAQLLELLET